jgi:hypothetical protein
LAKMYVAAILDDGDASATIILSSEEFIALNGNLPTERKEKQLTRTTTHNKLLFFFSFLFSKDNGFKVLLRLDGIDGDALDVIPREVADPSGGWLGGGGESSRGGGKAFHRGGSQRPCC